MCVANEIVVRMLDTWARDLLTMRRRTLCTIARTVARAHPHDRVSLQGFIASLRRHKGVTFLTLRDGDARSSVQVVCPPHTLPPSATLGACVDVLGELVPSPGRGQNVEVRCDTMDVLSASATATPLPPTGKHRHSVIRQNLHLQSRLQPIQSLLRVRQSLLNYTHSFYQSRDFLHVTPPVLTGNDCEGAGQVFEVTHGFDADHEDRLYFNRKAYLSVSSQLHLEAMAHGLKQVYSLAPAFRAERTLTPHHLSEFTMLEAEVAFCTRLVYLTQLVEKYMAGAARHVLDKCESELGNYWKYFSIANGRTLLERLAKTQFITIDYKEAIDRLRNSSESFEYEPKDGQGLKKEHENTLCRLLGDVPVFVLHFPSSLKPFYVKDTENFDLLLPHVGELCGGSLRENSTELLSKKLSLMSEQIQQQLSWYLELRELGQPPTGGFGIGYDRLVQALMSIHNIRDTLPFPRYYHHCAL